MKLQLASLALFTSVLVAYLYIPAMQEHSAASPVDDEVRFTVIGTLTYLFLLAVAIVCCSGVSRPIVKNIARCVFGALGLLSVVNFLLVMTMDLPYLQHADEAFSAIAGNGTSYYPIINGRHLHFRCYSNAHQDTLCQDAVQGSSCKTIVYEAGTPFYSSIWGNVLETMNETMSNQTELSQVATYCIYDRYGYGWSDYMGLAVSVNQTVEDLKQSLSQLGIEGHLILVGWSYGGIIAQVYAATHPTSVDGVVLVDSMDIYDINQNMTNDIELGKTSFHLLTLMQATGIPRLINSYPLESGYLGNGLNLDRTIRDYFNHVYHTCNFLQSSWFELDQLIDSLAYLKQLMDDHNKSNQTTPLLGNIPLVVLTATQHDLPDWIERQEELALLSTNHLHIINNYTDHFIPVHNATSIVNSIIQCTLLRSTVEIAHSS